MIREVGPEVFWGRMWEDPSCCSTSGEDVKHPFWHQDAPGIQRLGYFTDGGWRGAYNYLNLDTSASGDGFYLQAFTTRTTSVN